ncbi:unnamed protein product [Durusdinium trenchii]|uniref:Ketosynthase family 3 (KS3) domain-containing protein n=1 Tax=Durusdinium trenchii TaxID=1381693 RepID=A0ABP0LXU9_9DINO
MEVLPSQNHVEALLTEGYCVIDGRTQLQLQILQAQSEVAELVQHGSFRVLPDEIRSGLLGRGSCRIAELPSPLLCREGPASALETLDATLTRLAKVVSSYWQISGRSVGILHEASSKLLDAELTQAECCKWFGHFVCNRVMVLIYLGPGKAQLKLEPEEDGSESEGEFSDAWPVTEVLNPGDLVLVQQELQLRLHSREQCYCLSCFLQGRPQLTSCAKVLQEWAENYAETETPTDERLQLLQDHLYCKGLGLAVCSFGGRLPSSWQVDAWSSAQLWGPDVVLQVPLTRWDHEELYDPKPSAWQEGKTYCRHAGFMDGIDLFDYRLFNISVREAGEMEPRQRMALEVAYESLQRAGFRKPRLSASTGGIYVGAENWSEWDGCSTSSFTATGRASSILAGRISYVLGLKGPAVALDTGDCSGLTAVNFGAKALQEDGFTSIPEFCCSLGTSVLLAGHRWVSRQAAGLLSSSGRCFTFDSAASGLLPGEATGALILRREVDEPEGFLEGLAMQHLGRAASLSSASSSGEQEVLAESTLLDDAAEVLALCKVLGADRRVPLQLTALRPGQGGLENLPGLCALLRTLWAASHRAQVPAVHLRQLNSYLER